MAPSTATTKSASRWIYSHACCCN